MTTTGTDTVTPPSDTPPPGPTPSSPTPPTRVLRRVRTGRVGAGVGGGLGRYFDVDPVIFRVLFATTAFFGGAGILAYLLAWAAIPEEGTERAPVDGWIGELRRRRVPAWLVAVAAGLFLWAAAFSWWAPAPVLPIAVIVVLLVVAFGRRDLQGGAAPTVDLTKTGSELPDAQQSDPALHSAQPAWVAETRAWWDESRRASRERARRALPVKIATLGGLGVTLIVLAIVDASSGIPIATYFWVSLGFVLGGLVVGAALRRAPWSVATLLTPIAVGLIGFVGSHASFTDGIGDRTWTPTTTPAAQYRLALGQGTLDLRSLPAQSTPRTVRITAGAGQVRVLSAQDANVEVLANVHLGDVQVDGASADSGVGVQQVVPAPSGATGARITVIVHLADGQVDVRR